MRKLKSSLLIILFFSSIYIIAQKSANVISLTPVVLNNSGKISSNVSKILLNKMTQVLTKYEVSSINKRGEHIIYPSISVLSKNLTSTAPPKLFVNLELTFYIADYDRKLIFTSEIFNLKGVGESEDQAYISALKSLNRNNKKLEAFVKKGKEEVLNYYNSNCSVILNESDLLVKQNKFEDALILLSKVPANSDCYSDISLEINKTYKLYNDYNCRKNLLKANSVWSAEQNSRGARIASYYLSLILPNSNCSNGVEKLVSEIKTKIKENENKEWDYRMKSIDNHSEAKDVLLEAYKSLIEHLLSTQTSRKYNHSQFSR